MYVKLDNDKEECKMVRSFRRELEVDTQYHKWGDVLSRIGKGRRLEDYWQRKKTSHMVVYKQKQARFDWKCPPLAGITKPRMEGKRTLQRQVGMACMLKEQRKESD